MSTTPVDTPAEKPSNIIPILLPPQCAPQQEAAVKIGDKITVHLHDGKELGGALLQFLRNEKKLGCQLDGGDRAGLVPFVKIKYLAIPQARRFVPSPKLEALKTGAPPVVTEFMVEFKDGNHLEGQTMGYRTDAVGLFLYPCEGESDYRIVFVPHSSMEQYRIGKPLGTPTEDAGPADQAAANQEGHEDPQQGDAEEATLHMREVIEPAQLRKLLKHFKAAPKVRIGEILVKEGLISEQDLNEALAMQKQYRDQGKKMQIGHILMDLELISQSDLLTALSEKLGIPFIDLNKFKLDPEAIKYIPEELVKKYLILPLCRFENSLVVAIENPMDWEALDSVRFHSNLNIEPVMSTKVEIDRMIDVLYAAPDIEGTLFDDYLAGDDEEETTADEYNESAVEDNVIVKLVNKIIIDAYQQGASDIHIEPYPGKNKTVVRIRKDGSLRNYYEVPSKMRAALVARIKIMADLDISEKRKPQDGKIDFKKFSMLKIELRVATIPTSADMEDVVMRILASGEPVPLAKLGLSDFNFEKIQTLITKPYGLFFVCGPTGSGKTTTLHSILGYLNTAERKIWTAEDPVEITQKGLRQVQVNNKIGFTFAAAMRAFLRADPDIIMVGEMRDKETTSTGIEASLTGHMVLATLHTNSAPESIIRLLDMGMDPFNFADALIGILAQRLCKRLCANCKEEYEPDAAEMQDIVAEFCYELMPKNADDSFKADMHNKVLAQWKENFANEEGKFIFSRTKGCKACDDTGYKGRVGIHELLAATDSIKKKILDEATVAELTQAALEEGMRTLKQDGILKVLLGLTDLHSVRSVCIK